jgi:hypothetical protein
VSNDTTSVADEGLSRGSARSPAARSEVKLILRRNHVGVSVWRGGRLVAGLCCLVYPRWVNRPGLYPALHLALDWRMRMWTWFGGPSANGAVPGPRE